MSRIASFGFVALVVLGLTSGCSSTSEKYAILASTQVATVGTDGIPGDTDFWNDLVLTYCTLKEHGFSDENIFVLYGNGVDHTGSTHPYYQWPYCDLSPPLTQITDFPLNERIDNLCNVLCCASSGRPAFLQGGICKCLPQGQAGGGIGGFSCSGSQTIPRLEEDDFLVTWIKGHGASTNCFTNLTIEPLEIGNLSFGLSDQAFAGLVADLRAKHKLMLFETCDSGGWQQELGPTGAMVATSGGVTPPNDCVETSYPAPYSEVHQSTGVTTIVDHGRFSQWIDVALRQYDLKNNPISSDTNSDNLVSVGEAFEAAKSGVLSENASPDVYGGQMHPLMPDPQQPNSEDPSCTYLRLPVPVMDNRVFAMDHAGDNSLVPSNPSVGGGDPPGVWIRKNADGGTSHQNPARNESVTLYVRIHNIGCDDPGPVVAFFLVTGLDSAGNCESPSSIRFIGADLVHSIGIADSFDASASWHVPSGIDSGDHCLFSVLSSMHDLPDLDWSTVEDDNKVSRLITVQ